jgi:hypothetical protein
VYEWPGLAVNLASTCCLLLAEHWADLPTGADEQEAPFLLGLGEPSAEPTKDQLQAPLLKEKEERENAKAKWENAEASVRRVK